MSWRSSISRHRHTINKLPKLDFNSDLLPLSSHFQRNAKLPGLTSSFQSIPVFVRTHAYTSFQLLQFNSSRYIHSTTQTKLASSEEENDDGTMNEFLSRFVWIMRKKITQAYPGSNKQTIDGMLLIIIDKVVSELENFGLKQILDATTVSPSQDFSEDLWQTVWEVCNVVLDDMNKERKKEKMKSFLQCDEVKEMCRFAGEVGIRGDMLRELRFKWAREKMEENEFYEGLEELREEAQAKEERQDVTTVSKGVDVTPAEGEDKTKDVTLPKRRGKIRYKIYGLDLSAPKWAEVANKIHEAGEIMWPEEPKPIFGKCKLVTEDILSLNQEDDPSRLLAEWTELLQPSRVDWINLLDALKKKNTPLYLKVAEIALTEESFQTSTRDYSKLIDIYAQESRLNDAERILKKMDENGILQDALIANTLVKMYSKAGHLQRAKEAFGTLKNQGFHPNMNVYNAMIMAYVNAGQPRDGEILMREMETRDIKPTEEIYMALLRSFAQRGDGNGAERISRTMSFAGFPLSLESGTLLVEAFGLAGDPDKARSIFDDMTRLGQKPDDRCTASMIAVYEKKNLLDVALNLLLDLEKGGFEPGVATYTVLVDWFGKMQLVDEAEQILGKIAQQGEAPPFKLQVSLCDMYARAGVEKKALQSLGVLEARKEELRADEFKRIIDSLVAGGFMQDARRIHGMMEAQGFASSEELNVALKASEAFGRRRPSKR